MPPSLPEVLDVPASGMPPCAYWFGEDQGRYLLAVTDGAGRGLGVEVVGDGGGGSGELLELGFGGGEGGCSLCQ